MQHLKLNYWSFSFSPSPFCVLNVRRWYSTFLPPLTLSCRLLPTTVSRFLSPSFVSAFVSPWKSAVPLPWVLASELIFSFREREREKTSEKREKNTQWRFRSGEAEEVEHKAEASGQKKKTPELKTEQRLFQDTCDINTISMWRNAGVVIKEIHLMHFKCILSSNKDRHVFQSQ